MTGRHRRLWLAVAAALALSLIAPAVGAARTVVEARMTVIPGDPRVGDPVKIRVDGFRDARSVTPAFPFSENDRQTVEPAPFLRQANRRRPDIYTLRGGEEIYLPLSRTGPQSFETATFTWPDEGLWLTTPRFFVGDKVWAFRKRLSVRDGGRAPSIPQRVLELELVDEAAPGSPPEWAKPIAYALIAAFALAALALAAMVARLVRRWSPGGRLPKRGVA